MSEGDKPAKMVRKEKASSFVLSKIVAGKLKLFKGTNNEAYAVIQTAAARELWPVQGPELSAWLADRYYSLTRNPLPSSALRDTLLTMEGLARYQGFTAQVNLRVAGKDSDLFLDLGEPNWQAVQIHNGVWDLLAKPPVWFRRPGSMAALPIPSRDGDVGLLRRYINIGSNAQWLLVRAWLLAAMRPVGPYPVLVLTGQQGSAKTTTARFLRALVDPSVAPIRHAPRSIEDLIVAAENSHVLCFDNLSYIDHDMSDCLCGIATGSGYTTRRLFTNKDEVIFVACRPILTTSIEDIATRSDLLDRALVIHCPVLEQEQRRSEASLLSAFEADSTLIFGGALDTLARAQKRWRYVRDTGMPRMADFARFGVAIEQALEEEEGSFLSAYQGCIDQSRMTVLEGSVLVPPLVYLMRKERQWRGTATELLAALREGLIGQADPKHWPKNATALSNQLRRLQPNLVSLGIQADTTVSGGVKRWNLILTDPKKTDTIDTPLNLTEEPDFS